MEYFFVLAGVFALLFFIILISNKDKRSEHSILAVLLLLIIISCYYVFLLYHKDGDYYEPIFSEINYAIPIVYALLLWFYAKSLLLQDFKFRRLDVLHFLPYVAFQIYLFYIMANHKIEAEHKMGYPLIKLIVNPVYIFLTLHFLAKVREKLQDKYSYDVKMHHYWLSWISYGGLALWIVACIGNVFNYFNDGTSNLLGDYFLVSFLALLLFILAYVGFNRTQIFQSVDKNIQIKMDEEVIEPTGNDTEENKLLFEKLMAIMVEKKPYLDSKLSLHILAATSKIPAGKLSTIINRYGNSNFYDFVNGYRINMVKEKLVSEDMAVYSILGIAEECGFNSKASFNRVFKKKEGMTPTEYLKSLEK